MNNYERWQKLYEESHDIAKEEELVTQLSSIVDEPKERIMVECIGSRYYIKVSFKDEKSISFCKLIIEKLNKGLGGIQGLNNTLVELTQKGIPLYRCEVNDGQVIEKFINLDENGGE